ncbi:hypothetical protein ACJX0J_031162, partial [Zea mays]
HNMHQDFQQTSKSLDMSFSDIVALDVKEHPVVIYTKGYPDAPRCRFSALAVKTGTGKANTIEGEMRQKCRYPETGVSELLQDTVGVIPRAVHHIFEILAARKADYSIE